MKPTSDSSLVAQLTPRVHPRPETNHSSQVKRARPEIKDKASVRYPPVIGISTTSESLNGRS